MRFFLTKIVRCVIGEMIALIAHQWRQPLSQLSFNNMYLKKKIKDEALKEEISSNDEIIRFMSETIKNFETFYSEQNEESFASQDAINQAINICYSGLKHANISLHVELKSDTLIKGHQNNLSQMVLSLMQNAIDIHIGRGTPNPWIRVVLKDFKNGIMIVVEDNGGGIKAQNINDVFKLFYSAKKKPSTGLGLYLSSLVIREKFNSNIEVENTSLGAKFTILLNQSDNRVSQHS